MSELIILIPYYNAVLDLEATVSSISEDFSVDLLIIDDGSINKPNLEKLIKLYNNDGKIMLETLQKNKGIEKALNYGLNIIYSLDYKYIGRLDQGDLAIKDKFRKQLNYLRKNPDTYLLGTWGDIVDENLNHLYFLKHPVDYQKIKRKMYLNSCFIHPSVVYRRELLDTVGFYPENRKNAEDYAYFFKIIKKHKAENLPEVLMQYVIAKNSISSTRRKGQIKSRIMIIIDNFYLGLYPILGLLRNSILYFTHRNAITYIKRKLSMGS